MSYRGLVVTKLHLTIAIGIFVLAGVFAALGAVLVYLGATGATNMRLFGANVETANVGVAALFVAGVTTIVVVRRLLKSAEVLADSRPEYAFAPETPNSRPTAEDVE